MVINAVTTHPIRQVRGAQVLESADTLAIEEPLEIQLVYGPRRQSRPVSVTMRTPGHDEELAAGFLFTEGIIRHRQSIAAIPPVLPGQNTVQAILDASTVPRLQQADRNFYTTSSCGVCGKASIDAIKTVVPFPPATDELLVTDQVLHTLPGRLLAQQAVFGSTGGLHASALFTPEGELLRLREDVGRHNALDKLIGSAFLDDLLPLHQCLLLLSGRASFELIQKAAMAGISIVAAVGAPSSLAVSLAQEHGMTLIGFLREQRFNIYCGERRIRY